MTYNITFNRLYGRLSTQQRLTFNMIKGMAFGDQIELMKQRVGKVGWYERN